MNNKSHSPVTEMLSGKNKIWLLIGLALMSIADLSACIVLWSFGAAGAYWGVTFVMTAVDVLYLACVALSNQRFKYARLLFFVYIAVTAFFILIWLCESLLQNEVTFDNVMVAIWSLLHAVGIAAAVITYIYAARVLRGGRALQLGLAIAFSAVALVLVVYYGISIGYDGYFGQGNDTLPLVYSYIGDNECEVTGIVYGKGDSVVVPYEFNGRKVTKVSANLFTYSNVKSVTLNCDSDVALCDDISEVSSVNSDITIYVDKKHVDVIKSKLYGTIRESDYYWHSKLELGNSVRPINLDKDEVYITFDYDSESYKRANAAVIPTQYLKKGETFELSDIKGLDYVDRSDVDSDDDLYYCHENSGYIMSELKSSDGAAIAGAAIGESINNVAVRFQKVCRVYVGEGNDEMYSPAEHFEYSTVDGVTRDYKLTVAGKADELLEVFDRGEAFTRTMQYKPFSSSYYQKFTSLADVLSNVSSVVTIEPYWELVQPQVTISSVNDDNSVIFGDNVELKATATHPLDGAIIEYEWYDEIQRIGYENTLVKRAGYVGYNTFTVTVKVSAPQLTSCTTANAAEIKLNVLRRPLTVKWTDPEDNVYDGNTKHVTAELFNTIEDDYVSLSSTVFSQTNASTYTHTARLSGFNSNNYYIAEGETHTFTVLPRPVALTWDEQTEFEFDGALHVPTAQAYGINGVSLYITYYGRQTSAGEYTATAELSSSNYVIDEDSSNTVKFKITPAKSYVLWSNTELTYNGQNQAPTAVIKCVDGTYLQLIVSGARKDAGSGYEATATLPDGNNNYVLNSDKGTFSIARKTLNVYVQDFTIEYGQPLGDTCILDGIIENDDVIVESSIDYTPDEHGNVPIGEYDISITLSGKDKENYILNIVKSGKLTVTAPEKSETGE